MKCEDGKRVVWSGGVLSVRDCHVSMPRCLRHDPSCPPHPRPNSHRDDHLSAGIGLKSDAVVCRLLAPRLACASQLAGGLPVQQVHGVTPWPAGGQTLGIGWLALRFGAGPVRRARCAGRGGGPYSVIPRAIGVCSSEGPMLRYERWGMHPCLELRRTIKAGRHVQGRKADLRTRPRPTCCDELCAQRSPRVTCGCAYPLPHPRPSAANVDRVWFQSGVAGECNLAGPTQYGMPVCRGPFA